MKLITIFRLARGEYATDIAFEGDLVTLTTTRNGIPQPRLRRPVTCTLDEFAEAYCNCYPDAREALGQYMDGGENGNV